MKRYSNNKDINVTIRKLTKVQWVYKNGKKHAKLISPNGKVIAVSKTPSCCHAYANFRSEINRIKNSEARYGND
ncbi:Uncharacterised protein [BD1-7 clade bacterium]|uniref:Uncharacterized protein n=1 Tax=BD1-7 clade bacterium TaxID=2029982 RepID=A0A5S9PAB5_9GAMM|nr:Uncharacterised protein [BD1-7 clade bacterium]CAA0101479.1 Uncharacterised protein [BD1-7 clade bacterium]